MARFELNGAGAAFLSGDDPATAERWRQLLDELPDATMTFEGHLVGACDPPCEVCLAAYRDWAGIND